MLNDKCDLMNRKISDEESGSEQTPTLAVASNTSGNT